MLPKDFAKRPLEYILLIAILIVGAFSFILLSHSPHAQRNVIYLTGGTYLFWSLMHHYNRGDLTLSIVIEYLVVALFAALLITTTLLY